MVIQPDLELSSYHRADGPLAKVSAPTLLANAFHGSLAESKLALGKGNALITKLASPPTMAAAKDMKKDSQ